MASRTPSSRLAMRYAFQSACLPCVAVCAAQAFRWVVGYRHLALATDIVVFVYLLCSYLISMALFSVPPRRSGESLDTAVSRRWPRTLSSLFICFVLPSVCLYRFPSRGAGLASAGVPVRRALGWCAEP